MPTVNDLVQNYSCLSSCQHVQKHGWLANKFNCPHETTVSEPFNKWTSLIFWVNFTTVIAWICLTVKPKQSQPNSFSTIELKK